MAAAAAAGAGTGAVPLVIARGEKRKRDASEAKEPFLIDGRTFLSVLTEKLTDVKERLAERCFPTPKLFAAMAHAVARHRRILGQLRDAVYTSLTEGHAVMKNANKLALESSSALPLWRICAVCMLPLTQTTSVASTISGIERFVAVDGKRSDYAEAVPRFALLVFQLKESFSAYTTLIRTRLMGMFSAARARGDMSVAQDLDHLPWSRVFANRFTAELSSMELDLLGDICTKMLRGITLTRDASLPGPFGIPTLIEEKPRVMDVMAWPEEKFRVTADEFVVSTSVKAICRAMAFTSMRELPITSGASIKYRQKCAELVDDVVVKRIQELRDTVAHGVRSPLGYGRSLSVILSAFDQKNEQALVPQKLERPPDKWGRPLVAEATASSADTRQRVSAAMMTLLERKQLDSLITLLYEGVQRQMINKEDTPDATLMRVASVGWLAPVWGSPYASKFAKLTGERLHALFVKSQTVLGGLVAASFQYATFNVVSLNMFIGRYNAAIPSLRALDSRLFVKVAACVDAFERANTMADVHAALMLHATDYHLFGKQIEDVLQSWGVYAEQRVGNRAFVTDLYGRTLLAHLGALARDVHGLRDFVLLDYESKFCRESVQILVDAADAKNTDAAMLVELPRLANSQECDARVTRALTDLRAQIDDVVDGQSYDVLARVRVPRPGADGDATKDDTDTRTSQFLVTGVADFAVSRFVNAPFAEKQALLRATWKQHQPTYAAVLADPRSDADDAAWDELSNSYAGILLLAGRDRIRHELTSQQPQQQQQQPVDTAARLCLLLELVAIFA